MKLSCRSVVLLLALAFVRCDASPEGTSNAESDISDTRVGDAAADADERDGDDDVAAHPDVVDDVEIDSPDDVVDADAGDADDTDAGEADTDAGDADDTDDTEVADAGTDANEDAADVLDDADAVDATDAERDAEPDASDVATDSDTADASTDADAADAGDVGVVPIRCTMDSACGVDGYCADGDCTGRGAPGAACARSAMCANAVCVDGVCGCASDEECGADRYCDAGVCADTREAFDTCSRDAECSTGLCDERGQCVSCADHGECGAGAYCTAGVCAPTAEVGEECADGAACASGVCQDAACICADSDHCGAFETCVDGTCRTPCANHGACEDAEFCDAAGFCAPQQRAPAECARHIECLGACESDVCSDCPLCSDAEYCVDGGCVARDVGGASCVDADSCLSGLCADDVCLCADDSHCAPGDICLLDGTCAAPVALYGECAASDVCETRLCVDGRCAACGADSECESGTCIEGVCTRAAALGGRCNIEADTCVVGRCAAQPDATIFTIEVDDGRCVCLNDADCGADAWCDASGSDSPVEARGNRCFASCASNDDCPGAQPHCRADGRCVPLLRFDEACEDDVECASGICGPGGRCDDCRDGADCADGAYCRDTDRELGIVCEIGGGCAPNIVEATFQCADRAPAGGFCTRGEMCISGDCQDGLCAECGADEGCAAGRYCDAGTCRVQRPTGADCDEGAPDACASGRCDAAECVECTDDGHCDGVEVCRDGRCFAPLAWDSSCTENADCASGVCADRRCDCVDDGDCDGGDVCQGGVCGADCDTCPSDTACVVTPRRRYCTDEVPSVGEVCLLGMPCDGMCVATPSEGDSPTLGICSACVSDADCDGYCDLSVGACRQYYACDRDATCDGTDGGAPYCITGGGKIIGSNVAFPETTDLPGLCHPCREDGHCGADERCEVADECAVSRRLLCSEAGTSSLLNPYREEQYCTQCVATFECVPRLEVGAPCDDSGDCLSGECVAGICGCAVEGDCPTGLFCNAGRCGLCADSGDCTGDAYCRSGGFCEPRAPLGSPCMFDDLCSSLECRESIPGFGTCACDDDGDCAGDVCVDDGRCVECIADSDCSGDTICDDEVCVECANDGDCDSDSYCEVARNECVPRRAIGQPCTFPSECIGDRCELAGGAMRCTCSSPADCPGDQTCVPGADRCVECLSSAECGANEYCDAGDCASLLGLGESCGAPNECASGACAPHEGRLQCVCDGDGDCPSGDHCVTSTPTCAECTSNAHCGASAYCGPGRVCMPLLSLGASCVGPHECASGACAPHEGRLQCVCDGDGDCPSGDHCVMSTPTCAECTSNAHCGASAYCGPGGVCTPLFALGASCVGPHECASGACAPHEGRLQCVCDGDGDCPSGDHCVASTPTCAECTSNAHCGASEFCGPGRVCTPLLELGDDCVGLHECASGACAPFAGRLQCVCDEHSDCGTGRPFCRDETPFCDECTMFEGCGPGQLCDPGSGNCFAP